MIVLVAVGAVGWRLLHPPVGPATLSNIGGPGARSTSGGPFDVGDIYAAGPGWLSNTGTSAIDHITVRFQPPLHLPESGTPGAAYAVDQRNPAGGWGAGPWSAVLEQYGSTLMPLDTVSLAPGQTIGLIVQVRAVRPGDTIWPGVDVIYRYQGHMYTVSNSAGQQICVPKTNTCDPRTQRDGTYPG